jgi:hypothetical protein
MKRRERDNMPTRGGTRKNDPFNARKNMRRHDEQQND